MGKDGLRIEGITCIYCTLIDMCRSLTILVVASGDMWGAMQGRLLNYYLLTDTRHQQLSSNFPRITGCNTSSNIYDQMSGLTSQVNPGYSIQKPLLNEWELSEKNRDEGRNYNYFVCLPLVQ